MNYKEVIMPVIKLETGPVSHEKKLELLKALPEAASCVTGIPISEFRTFINEYDTDCIGVGDIPLSEHLKK